jgi:hypothetical protein
MRTEPEEITTEVLTRLERIEEALLLLVEERSAKDRFYSTEEAAALLGKAAYTVREWCRQGRVHAEKHQSGRGAFTSWTVSHEEILRIRREGLLPPAHPTRNGR